MSLKTVGIIITTGRSLKDEKCECVSKFLSQELNSLQYVSKLTVIPDKLNAIIKEVESLVRSRDIILIVGEKCGTIYEAIGELTSQKLERNEELVGILKDMQESYEEDEVLLPRQTKLMHTSEIYPVIHCQRIFILKEKYAKQCFSNVLKNHLAEYRKPRNFRKTIQVIKNGNAIDDLDEIIKISNNCITVNLSKTDKFFIFNIASTQLSSIVQFENKIKTKFEPYQLRFIDDSDTWEFVYSSQERHVKTAIESIEQCLKEFGMENVFLSFNGGKDCTVLLHLVLTVIKKKYPHNIQPIFCLYVQSDEPFPEQEEFINQTKNYYNLQIITIRSGIKDALQETLEKYPNYRACFMGTRRTDPYSRDLNNFQMTDSNWPQIMRVNPLLDWHYSDIWDYLLYYKVPYCSLYDMGYTSLGNTINTTKNPSLLYFDEVEGQEMYLPAYKLLRETNERHGRNSS